MRFFAVWLYCSSRIVFDRLVGLREWAGQRIAAARIFLLRRMDYRTSFRLAHLARALGMTGRRRRNLARVAEENKRCLLGPGVPPLNAGWIFQRRELLDLAATYGQNPRLLAELRQCAGQLDRVVKPLHEAGSPVILAPLHMVSDILAGIVGSMVWPHQATVVVSASAEVYQARDRAMGGINLNYCSIHGDNSAIAGNLTEAIMEAAEHRRNIMIFPDITPDYTASARENVSAKMACRLFGRPAHLHSGIIRAARMLSAQVVFYYLYYDGGLKIYLEQPVAARDLKRRMPLIIEAAMRRHPADWLLWHGHSLYFINE